MKGSHSVSVLQGKEKYCYITGREYGLHKHHIYYGTGNRAVSDKHGFWVWLIPELHNMSSEGIHNGKYRTGYAVKTGLPEGIRSGRTYKRRVHTADRKELFMR